MLLHVRWGVVVIWFHGRTDKKWELSTLCAVTLWTTTLWGTAQKREPLLGVPAVEESGNVSKRQEGWIKPTLHPPRGSVPFLLT